MNRETDGQRKERSRGKAYGEILYIANERISSRSGWDYFIIFPLFQHLIFCLAGLGSCWNPRVDCAQTVIINIHTCNSATTTKYQFTFKYTYHTYSIFHHSFCNSMSQSYSPWLSSLNITCFLFDHQQPIQNSFCHNPFLLSTISQTIV